jgi:hypothetical protein
MNLFERLSKERPSPSSTRKARQLEGAQKLLDWLQRWSKDTVTVRDVHIYGPHPVRGQKNVLAAAKILVKNGWLAPIKVRRYDANKWQIVRRPPIIAPNVKIDNEKSL